MKLFWPFTRQAFHNSAVYRFEFWNPALMLLGKVDWQSPWGWLSYILPVVAIVLVIISAGIWHLAIQRYLSSGS